MNSNFENITNIYLYYIKLEYVKQNCSFRVSHPTHNSYNFHNLLSLSMFLQTNSELLYFASHKYIFVKLVKMTLDQKENWAKKILENFIFKHELFWLQPVTKVFWPE